MASEKITAMIEEVKALSVLELNELVKALEEEFGSKRETFTFTALPESLAEMQALPEACMDSPFKTAALTVLALCAYAADKNIGTEMLL